MRWLSNIYKPILFAAVILFCLVVSFLLYSGVLRKNYQNEIISSLEEVSSQNQTMLENEIVRIQELVAEVSRRISLYDSSEYEEAVKTLGATCADNGFKRMGIIRTDGTAFTTDHETTNLADRDYFVRSMHGERCISEPLTDKIGSGSIHVYSAPVYRGHEINGVLFATYDSDSMQKQLAIPSFGGQGYTYIVNQKGDTIVKSNNVNSCRDMENIFTSLRDADSRNEESALKLQEDLAAGREGCIKFYNQGCRYLYYVPGNVNDWYLLTVAPAAVLDDKMNTVLRLTYVLGTFLTFLFVVILLYVSGIQKKQKKQLLQVVFEDPVTGGYSYARFLTETKNLIKKPEAGPFAVLDLDIDDFKFINELFGYEEGDRLIRSIHQTLSEWCRPGEVYAHKASDIFVALIADRDPFVTEERLQDLSARLCGYFHDDRNRIQVVPSIGLFHISDPTQSMDYCLDCAGIARKSVKGKYDAHYAFYDEAIRQQIYQEKLIEANMKSALENHEFVVYYQPQYDTFEKRIVGAEGLVRWRKPDGTLAAPGTFIPLFEKNGFITQLDEYMFRTICAQQKRWLDEGLNPVPVSVNLSRMQLYDLNFVSRYIGILKELELPVKYVEVEITESVFFDNQPQITEAINRLHRAGFVILLDDFGTGYSSMSMLKNMNLDTLKIDKSFVDSIGNSRGDKVVDGILRLADSLGLRTIAEGVETLAQYEYLKNHGCDVIQGFFFGKPMETGEFEKLISRNGKTHEKAGSV